MALADYIIPLIVIVAIFILFLGTVGYWICSVAYDYASTQPPYYNMTTENFCSFTQFWRWPIT